MPTATALFGTTRCLPTKRKMTGNLMAVFRGLPVLHFVSMSVFILLGAVTRGNEVLTHPESHVIHHIRHFEEVHYDHEHLQRQHHVTRRSPETSVRFSFDAYDRKFKVRLRRDIKPFHPDVTIETSSGRIPYDIRRTYIGHLEDVASTAYGMITSEGHFEGRIVAYNTTYFIERSRFHFPTQPTFHSLIYKASDVTFDPSHTSCQSDALHQKQLAMQRNTTPFGANRDDVSRDYGDRYTEGNRYSNNASSYHSNDGRSHSNKRHRRSVDPAKVMCELYMQADHLYYQRYADADVVVEKLTQHVQAINQVYLSTDFDGDGASDSIGFIIKKIKVYDDPNAAGYRYPGNYGVETFLDRHSQENYDAFCLSYLFTVRDFDAGVLGLAWVGDTAAAGGVCEKYATFNGVTKSLNTGIVTIKNYGAEVPFAVSTVTFAHEVGHNFGSPHDPDDSADCSPGGDNGNYVMYARATSGDKTNNDKLSTCSVGHISPVLEVKARNLNGCFQENTGAICGNRVVEAGEECDCGWSEECSESCCNPQDSNPSPSQTPCTKKASAVCSPSEGACCNATCQYHLLAANVTCRPDSGCQESAVCDGENHNSTCPASAVKPDAIPCGDGLVCLNGECSGSICLAHSRQPCQCEPAVPGDWKDALLCQVCCLDDNGDCKSSSELADVPESDVIPGSPCYNYEGYCDVFKKCKKVQPEGPLGNLKKLILSGEALDTLKTFLTQHWYIGVAAGVGLIVIIALVVKFCSKSHKAPDHVFNSPRNYNSSSRNRVSPDKWM